MCSTIKPAMLFEVACRCWRRWWQGCLRARRSSSSACRSESPCARRCSACLCSLLTHVFCNILLGPSVTPGCQPLLYLVAHLSIAAVELCRRFRRAAAAGDELAQDVVDQLLKVLSAGACLSFGAPLYASWPSTVQVCRAILYGGGFLLSVADDQQITYKGFLQCRILFLQQYWCIVTQCTAHEHGKRHSHTSALHSPVLAHPVLFLQQ